MNDSPFTLDAIRAARARIAPHIAETPVWRWEHPNFRQQAEVFLKLELFQKTGTFKARGACFSVSELDAGQLGRGVTAVSAGNHAIAVAYAAGIYGSSAKLVMPKQSPPYRMEKVRDLGAELVLADDIHAAFQEVERIRSEEGRAFIHPFDDRSTVLGQATLGLELGEQIRDLDALVIPVGGGGLAAGIAVAMKALQPNCLLYGVEPTGADSMSQSFAAGAPRSIESVETIADSLGAPGAEQYTYDICRSHLHDVVTVSDEELRGAMRLLFHDAKLACEPACAAATAALLGPLRERLEGKRVALIACGSNIDLETFCQLVC